MVELQNFNGEKFNAREPPMQTMESFVGSELFENAELAYQGQATWLSLEIIQTLGEGFKAKQSEHHRATTQRFNELAEKLKKVVDPNFRNNEERKVVNLQPSQKFKYYFDFLLKSLVKGQMDRTAYEENCMMLFGPQAYVLFTMDHWMANYVRMVSLYVSFTLNKRLIL